MASKKGDKKAANLQAFIMPKTVGIIGGMGPESTIALMQKIVALTPAKKEQDHIRLLIDNRPQIPDRTEYLLGRGPSPLPMLLESARLLGKWGAELIAIACNTAHYFIGEIQEAVNAPVLDMLRLLAAELERRYPPEAALGILATSGSRRSGLFEKYLPAFTLIFPPEQVQEDLIREVIYGAQGIKAGGDLAANREKILRAVQTLKDRRPVCLIAGCTEIGLALEGVSLEIPAVNPLDLLAREIVAQAAG